MKPVKSTILLALLLGTVCLQAAPGDNRAVELKVRPALRVLWQGKAQSFDKAKQQSVRYWFQQLMYSCLVTDVVQDSSPEEWQRAANSPATLLVNYGRVATLACPERATVLTFEEALLPLEHPDYIFIRRGTEVLRLAKYDPWVLRKLGTELGLPLYGELENVERHGL